MNNQSATAYFAKMKTDWETFQKSPDCRTAKNNLTAFGMPPEASTAFINHVWKTGWMANNSTAAGTPPVIQLPRNKKNK